MSNRIVIDMLNEKWKPLETLVGAKKKPASAASKETLSKLHELITDPLTKDSSSTVGWINRLLDSFLRDVADVGGYYLEDLSIVTELLEFLAQRASSIEEYQKHVGRMLELCELPPLHGQTGNRYGYTVVLERYFNTLGHLTTVLPNERDTAEILRIIDHLLVRSDKGANVSAVKADSCLSALEKSEFPKIVCRLVEIHSGIMYKRVLDLVFLLAANSRECCQQMLEAGLLELLLIRMDSREAYTEDNGKSFLQDIQSVSWKECTIVAINIARVLVQSMSSNACHPNLRNIAEPNSKVTRSLRNVLRRQVCESNRGNNEADIILRNDIAEFILAGMVAFPAWNLIHAGLAEDLIVLSIATETGARGTWAEDVKFRINNEDDLSFKKMMLSIVRRLCDYPGGAMIDIMSEHRIISGVLELIEPQRTTLLSRSLSEFAMRILARLVPEMPREFIFHKGAPRLVRLFAQSCNSCIKFDNHVVMQLTKTICNIITRTRCPRVLESFHRAGLISSLVEFVNRILSFDRLTTQHQRILTLLIVTVGEIALAKEAKEAKDGRMIEMLTKSLKRCFYQRNDDFQLDQRLLIAIGSCIWECIVNCPENTKEFVKNGGTYMLLDVIENSIFPVRCVYLGILTDMLCTAECGVVAELCTWRGATDKTRHGFTSLLAKSWREEEIRTGVKRTPEGFIEDPEVPIMGTEYRISAFHSSRVSTSHLHSSPAIVALLGSLRVKIYALGRLVNVNQSDRYEISKQHYRILSEYDANDDESAAVERITMYIADRLYRFSQGQVWSEVSRYLEERGVNVLGMDGEIMMLMKQRHGEWATYVRGLQEKSRKAQRKMETERERQDMARIRESKLGSTLNALENITYIRRTTERSYTVRMKNLQRAQIIDASTFSGYGERENCHSCLDDKTNVTTIFQEIHTIPSVRTHNPVIDTLELPLVSPAVSLTSQPVQLSSSSTEDSELHLTG